MHTSMDGKKIWIISSLQNKSNETCWYLHKNIQNPSFQIKYLLFLVAHITHSFIVYIYKYRKCTTLCNIIFGLKHTLHYPVSLNREVQQIYKRIVSKFPVKLYVCMQIAAQLHVTILQYINVMYWNTTCPSINIRKEIDKLIISTPEYTSTHLISSHLT